jgi:hypothetical protein
MMAASGVPSHPWGINPCNPCKGRATRSCALPEWASSKTVMKISNLGPEFREITSLLTSTPYSETSDYVSWSLDRFSLSLSLSVSLVFGFFIHLILCFPHKPLKSVLGRREVQMEIKTKRRYLYMEMLPQWVFSCGIFCLFS